MVRLRHKNHLVRVRKMSCFGLKYQVLSLQTRLDRQSVEMGANSGLPFFKKSELESQLIYI